MNDEPGRQTDLAVDPKTRRQLWARVAKAAATHQRSMAGEDVYYGDPSLQRPTELMARGSLLRAIERAVRAGVNDAEIIDAICSGAPTLDVGEAHDYVEAVPAHRDALQKLTARILRDVLGETED